jgi:hypothetical protein
MARQRPRLPFAANRNSSELEHLELPVDPAATELSASSQSIAATRVRAIFARRIAGCIDLARRVLKE